MPKKFVGENSKASEARARKEAVRKDQQLKKQQEIDDAYWKDDDKHVTKKLQRKVSSIEKLSLFCRYQQVLILEWINAFIASFRKTKKKKGRNN